MSRVGEIDFFRDLDRRSGSSRRRRGFIQGDSLQAERELTATERLAPGLFRDDDAYRIYEQTLAETKADPLDGVFSNIIGGFRQANDDFIIQLGQNGLNFSGYSGDEAKAYFMARQQMSMARGGDTTFEQGGFAVGQLAGETLGTGAAFAAAGAGLGLLGGPFAPLTSTAGAVAGFGLGLTVSLGRLAMRAFDGGYYESMNDQMRENQRRLLAGEDALEFSHLEANTRGAAVAGAELAIEAATARLGKLRRLAKGKKAVPAGGILKSLEDFRKTDGLTGRTVGAAMTVGGGAISEGLEEVAAEFVNMGVGQIQDTIAGREVEGRWSGQQLFDSFLIGAMAGGVMNGTTSKIAEAVGNIAVEGNAKRIMPEVAKHLRTGTNSTELSAASVFTGKTQEERDADLNGRRELIGDLKDARQEASEEAQKRQKMAGRKGLSEKKKAEHLAAAQEAQDAAESMTMDIEAHEEVLEALEEIHAAMVDGIAVTAVDSTVGRESSTKVLKKYGEKPRKEGDTFTPVSAVEELTEDEQQVADELLELGATEVVFYEGGEGTALGGKPAFYSTESAGTIYIRRRPATNSKLGRMRERTIMRAFALHELVHMVQFLDPQLATEIRELVGDLGVYRGASSYFDSPLDGRPVLTGIDKLASDVLTGQFLKADEEIARGILEKQRRGLPLTDVELKFLADEAGAALVETEGLAKAIEKGALALEGDVSAKLAAMGVLGRDAKIATKVISRLKAAQAERQEAAGSDATMDSAQAVGDDVTGVPQRAAIAAVRAQRVADQMDAAHTAAETDTDASAPGVLSAREGQDEHRVKMNARLNDQLKDLSLAADTFRREAFLLPQKDSYKFFEEESLRRAHADARNPRSRNHLAIMTPEEFLAFSRPQGVGEYAPPREDSMETLAESLITQGEKIRDIPALYVGGIQDNDGIIRLRIEGHEGRHRARTLQIMNEAGNGPGIMPVVIISKDSAEMRGVAVGRNEIKVEPYQVERHRRRDEEAGTVSMGLIESEDYKPGLAGTAILSPPALANIGKEAHTLLYAREEADNAYGKAISNVTVHDVRQQVPEESRTGGEPIQINSNQVNRMRSGASFSEEFADNPVDVQRVRSTRVDYGVRLTQDSMDQMMVRAEGRLKERHGDDAVDRAKASIAMKVKAKKTATFEIGTTRDGIRPDAQGVMTQEEYAAAVAANPPQPDIAEDSKENKIIRHTVTYSEDGSYRAPNADFVTAAVQGSWAQRFWYEAFGQDLVRAFPFMAGMKSLARIVSQFISATSPRTNVRDNLRRALGLTAAHIAGRPTNVSVMEPKGPLEAEAGTYGDKPSQFKVGSFNNTLALGMGTAETVPMATLDVIMARFFGIPQEAFADPLVYELFSDYMGLVTAEINRQRRHSPAVRGAEAAIVSGARLDPADSMLAEPFRPWQLQAVMWSTRGDDTGTFSESLDEFLEQAYEAGLAESTDGVLTMSEEAFSDPKVEELLDDAAEIRSGARATITVATDITVEGRRASNMAKYLIGKITDPSTPPQERARYQRLLAELNRPNNSFLNTLSANRSDLSTTDLLKAAMSLDNGALMVEAIVDPAGAGLVRGTLNAGKRAKLYEGGKAKVGQGKRAEIIKVKLTGSHVLVQVAAGAELNRTVAPTMKMSKAATSNTHVRTTSPGMVTQDTGVDGAPHITGPLGVYHDADGELVVNNHVNVIVPGGNPDTALQAVRLLAVSLGQEGANAFHLTDTQHAPDGQGVTVVFLRGHQISNLEMARITNYLSDPAVKPIVQPVSNGSLVIFANLETSAETEQDTQDEIKRAFSAVLPDVECVATTPSDGARLQGSFEYVHGEPWSEKYPGQEGPTREQIAEREDEIILEAAIEEIDSGTWFDGVPAGELGAEVFESDADFAARQTKLKGAQEAAEEKLARAESQYDNAVKARNKAKEAGKETAELDKKLKEKRTARSKARNAAQVARDNYAGAKPEPKRANKLTRPQRDAILRVAPTRAEQLALIAPSAVARQGADTGSGQAVVNKVWGRVRKLPPDDQARVGKAVAGSRAFRLHHVRSSVKAHSADFDRARQGANDSVAKKLGNADGVLFAREPSSSRILEGHQAHVLTWANETHRFDVEHRSAEHQVLVNANPAAVKMYKALSRRKAEKPGLWTGVFSAYRSENSENPHIFPIWDRDKLADLTNQSAHNLTDEEIAERVSHQLVIHPDDYGWNMLKEAKTVGEALQIIAFTSPEARAHRRLQVMKRAMPDNLHEDLDTLYEEGRRIRMAQGGRQAALQTLASLLLDQGVGLDAVFSTVDLGMGHLGAYIPPSQLVPGFTRRPGRIGHGDRRIEVLPNQAKRAIDLPMDWTEKGIVILNPIAGRCADLRMTEPGCGFGADAIGIWEVLLHEFAHLRTSLAINDELNRNTDQGYTMQHPAGPVTAGRSMTQALRPDHNNDSGSLTRCREYLALPESKRVPWMTALCSCYVEAAAYYKQNIDDKQPQLNGSVVPYDLSNLHEFTVNVMTHRGMQEFLATIPIDMPKGLRTSRAGLPTADEQMQTDLKVSLMAVEEMMGLPEDKLVTNHGGERSVLEVAMSAAYRVMKHGPADTIPLTDSRDSHFTSHTSENRTPILYAREGEQGKPKKIPMRRVDRERQGVERRLGKRRGAGAMASALQVIMDRERERLAAREGTRPDIAALKGLEMGADIQAEIARVDKEAALRAQMQKFATREADLKAKRVTLEDARMQTRKFIVDTLPEGKDRDTLTTRLMRAKTEEALLKLEFTVVRKAAQVQLRTSVNRFENRASKLLKRGTKMDDETRRAIRDEAAKVKALKAVHKGLPKTGEEASDFVDAANDIDQLLVNIEMLYRNDREAMREARDEQIARIDSMSARMQLALETREDRPRDVEGTVDSNAFVLAQRGGLDLQATLKLIGLEAEWDVLRGAESRMLNARREHMYRLDEMVQRAGFRDMADFRARASNTRGHLRTETFSVVLGGQEYQVTLGQFLKLLALDTETMTLIGKRGRLQLRAGAVGSEVEVGGPDLVGDILKIRASAPANLRNLVAEMKQAREEDLRNPAMAALFRLTGTMPPMIQDYEPRTAAIGGRIIALEDLKNLQSGGEVARQFAENAGFTKQRSGAVPVVTDFADDYLSHMDSTLELAHMGEPVRVLWSALTQPENRRLLTKKLGNEGYNRLLSHVGYATRVMPANPDKALGFMATVTGGILVLSPTSWGRILFGGLNTLHLEYTVPQVGSGLMKVMGMLTRGEFNEFFRNEVANKSGYLWDRDSSNAVDRRVVFNRDDGAAGIADIAQLQMVLGDVVMNIAHAGKAAMKGDMSAASSMLNQARRSLGGLPRAIPTLRLLDRIIVATAVQVEMDKRGETQASPESISAAESSIRRTQNTSSPLDDSNVTARLRTSGGYWQNLLTFTSDPMKTYSRLYEPGIDASKRAHVATVAIAGNAAISAGVTYLWQMLLASLIPDEEEKNEVLRELHKEKATDRVLDIFLEEGIVRASPFPLVSFLGSRLAGSILAEELQAHVENREADHGKAADYLSDSFLPIGLGTLVGSGKTFIRLLDTADPDKRAELYERLFTDGLLLIGVPAPRLIELLERAFTDASPAEIRSAEYQLRKMLNVSEQSGNQLPEGLKPYFTEARKHGAELKKERDAARARGE